MTEELPALQTAHTDGGPTKRPRRPALSCVECRLRKVKCDRNKPCGACIRIKSEKCTYRPLRAGIRASVDCAETRTSVDKSKSPAGSNSPRPGRSLGLTNEFDLIINRYVAPGIFGAHGKPQLKPLSDRPTLDLGSDNARDRDRDNTINSLQKKIDELEERLGKESTLPARTTLDRTSSTPGTFVRSRYFGQSHWANAIQPYEALGDENVTVNPNTDRVEMNKSTALYKTVIGIKRMSRIVKTARMLPPSIPEEASTSLPAKDICDTLVECYLRTFEGVFRILHVPSFRKEYDEYWSNPLGKPSVQLKVMLVCAMGVPFYTGPEQPRLRVSCVKWVQAAEMWLSTSDEKLRLNMSGLQIQILLLLARQVCGIEGDLVWIAAGSLLRTAMHLGLHRDPSHIPRISVFRSEMRRRLWATVLEMTVQSSLDMGMPPMISGDDYDTKAPSNVDDKDIAEDSTILDEKPLDEFTQSSIQIGFVETLPIRLEIIRLINNLRFDLPYDDVLRLGTGLINTCGKNMAFYKASLAKVTPFQIKLADSLVRRFVLCLHRPYFAKAKDDPRYHYSRKVCLETSLTIFAPVTEPVPAQEDDWTRMTHHAVGFLKASLLYAISTVYYELNSQIDEQKQNAALFAPIVGSSQPVALPAQFQSLYAVLCSSYQIAVARLRNGEGNGKGVIFLACALARIDSLIAGTDTDAATLDAATQAVKDIEDILTTVYYEEHGKSINLAGGGGQYGRGDGADFVPGQHSQTGTDYAGSAGSLDGGFMDMPFIHDGMDGAYHGRFAQSPEWFDDFNGWVGYG